MDLKLTVVRTNSKKWQNSKARPKSPIKLEKYGVLEEI